MFSKSVFRYCVAVACLVITSGIHAQHPRLDTIRERLESRNYPSLFSAWGNLWHRGPASLLEDIPDLAPHEEVAIYDVHWGLWGIHYLPPVEAIHTNAGLGMKREVERLNPNMVFLAPILVNEAHPSMLPADSPYWIRDDNGDTVPSHWAEWLLLDFTHPDMQENIIKQAVLAAESGLYDGVFFDWWNEGWAVLKGYRTLQEEVEARLNILRGIRERINPDFLIIVNANDGKIPLSAPYVNGAFMETFADQGDGYSLKAITHLERTLLWHSANLRAPQATCLEGSSGSMPVEKLRSAGMQRWMRLFTTMSLTCSNGSVLYTHDRGHAHIWYDFWDADLGRPIEPPADGQQFEGRDHFGSFVRQFENGWAVYNRSDTAHVVSLPEVTAAVSTGKYDYIHEVPPMDGEIFLRSHPTRVALRDKLATMWGAMKEGK